MHLATVRSQLLLPATEDKVNVYKNIVQVYTDQLDDIRLEVIAYIHPGRKAVLFILVALCV